MPSNATGRERVVQIAPQEKTSRKALVVGRDALTGGLLADALNPIMPALMRPSRARLSSCEQWEEARLIS